MAAYLCRFSQADVKTSGHIHMLVQEAPAILFSLLHVASSPKAGPFILGSRTVACIADVALLEPSQWIP